MKATPRFVLFGGKGGTGKTTVAAATAIYHAEKGMRTLVVSTDPAHSLSDSFEKEVLSKPTELSENLYGLELDAREVLKEKRLISTTLHEILRALEIYDVDVLETLPGVDEAMAYDKLIEYVEAGEYDVVVFDTAPTGHALRFLSIPGLMETWIRKLYRVRTRLADVFVPLRRRFRSLKRQEIERPSYWDELEERRRVHKVYEALTNPDHSSFWFVMLPERMCISETKRAVKTLSKYGIPIKGVIVNQLLPEKSDCRLCTARRALQEENLRTIRVEFKGLEIKELPLFNTEISGYMMLRKVADLLYH